MNIDALSFDLLGPAFCAGLLVLLTHVPLGREVLQRGIVFIDLAIAQVAALGLLAAGAAGWEPHGWEMQAVATLAALSAAVLLTWTERRWEQVQEALIGALFVLSASAALILVSRDPHGGEHLQDLLAGQILWTAWSDLPALAITMLLILAVWNVFAERIGRLGFYLLFAVAVTTSVQQVGVYLVFSSLILPALAVRSWPARNQSAGAWMIGAGGYLLGLVVSALYDLPPGAVVVWSLAMLGLAANRCRRYHGQHLNKT